MAPDTASQPQKLKFGLHVHVFVAVSIVVWFVAAFLLAGLVTHPNGSSASILVGAVSGVAALAAVLALSARYCGSEVLSYWNGLRLISAYVSYNIGVGSLLFSFISITIAMAAGAALTVFGSLTGNRSYAQQQFLRLIHFFSEHRMYQ